MLSIKGLKRFREYNLYEKGLTESSIDSYVSDISGFFSFLKENDCILTQESINDYFKFLNSMGLKNNSIRRKQMSIRCLIDFFNQLNLFKKQKEYFFTPLKKEQSNIKIISKLEFSKLLEYCDSQNNLLDKSILSLLYCSGLRVSELVSLNIKDTNLTKREVRINGKGYKERLVPISLSCSDILKKYLQEKKLKIDLDLSPLLVNNNNVRLNRFYVRDRILNMCRKCRIGNFSPHDLRHSCATNLLNSGMDLDLIKIFLGHSNISETQIYLSVSQEKLKKVHKEFHPIK